MNCGKRPDSGLMRTSDITCSTSDIDRIRQVSQKRRFYFTNFRDSPTSRVMQTSNITCFNWHRESGKMCLCPTLVSLLVSKDILAFFQKGLGFVRNSQILQLELEKTQYSSPMTNWPKEVNLLSITHHYLSLFINRSNAKRLETQLNLPHIWSRKLGYERSKNII